MNHTELEKREQGVDEVPESVECGCFIEHYDEDTGQHLEFFTDGNGNLVEIVKK